MWHLYVNGSEKMCAIGCIHWRSVRAEFIRKFFHSWVMNVWRVCTANIRDFQTCRTAYHPRKKNIDITYNALKLPMWFWVIYVTFNLSEWISIADYNRNPLQLIYIILQTTASKQNPEYAWHVCSSGKHAFQTKLRWRGDHMLYLRIDVLRARFLPRSSEEGLPCAINFE